MTDLFENAIPHLAGFRLQYLEVLNWGTFNKVRKRIFHPQRFMMTRPGLQAKNKNRYLEHGVCSY